MSIIDLVNNLRRNTDITNHHNFIKLMCIVKWSWNCMIYSRYGYIAPHEIPPRCECEWFNGEIYVFNSSDTVLCYGLVKLYKHSMV